MHSEQPATGFERGPEFGGGAFIGGLLMGVAVGAALGALFAPKAGNELRRQLADSSGRFRRSATDALDAASKKANDLVTRSRDAVDRGREAVERGVERGKDALAQARKDAKDVKRETVEAFPGAGSNMGV
jgi:gas vesicle protein